MSLFVLPRQYTADQNGEPRVGALASFYAAGTATPITTYTTKDYTITHANPVVSLGGGLFPAIYINPAVNATCKVVITDADGVSVFSEDNVPALGFTASDVGQLLYPVSTAETVAVVTPADLTKDYGDVRRYGADPTGAVDSTTAFNNAIASNARSFAPQGSYRIDGSITVPSTKILSLDNAILTRGGAATTPMVYVLGTNSALHGGTIVTANASPQGCVVLGNANTTVNMNSWWWRFTNCNISGRVNAAGDIGVYVPSGQITFPANANYFGTIQNINIHGFDIQMYLAEMANAHNVSNIQFWNGKTVGLRLRGAYANNVNNMFFHSAAANGYVAVQVQNRVAAGATNDSTFNQITNWTTETLGAADLSLVIESNCDANTIACGSNVLGGYTLGNLNNNVIINAQTVASNGFVTSKAISAGTTLAVAGAATVGSLAFGTSGVAKQTSTAAVASGSAQFITPAAFLSVAPSGATLAVVNISDTTNNNLSRTDLVLLNIRDSGHSPSTVTAVSNAFTSSATTGEPTAATYTLDFTGGATVPRLKANITRLGGAGSFDTRVSVVSA